MSTLRTNTLSNVAGTASTAIENAINGSAKAWVNFNGTGTVAIRAQYNVSSITDNGTGDYTVNFTNAMVDANYAVAGSGVDSPGGAVSLETYSTGTTLAGSVRVASRNSGIGFQDNALICIAIFR